MAGEKSGAARVVEATPSEHRNGIEQIPLPGLNVALGMSVDEVARAYVRRRFEHLPEERWQKNGTTFRRPERAFTLTGARLKSRGN